MVSDDNTIFWYILYMFIFKQYYTYKSADLDQQHDSKCDTAFYVT